MAVISAVNGVAAGAGASLTFACDLRIVSDSAGFNLAFSAIALSCDTGASWTLPRLIGRGKALELLYFPRTIPAAEALDLGLVTSVAPAADFEAVVAEVAGRMAAGPTLAYAAIRRAVTNSATASFEEALAFEGEQMQLTGATQDHHDAVAAFVAKRPAVFRGQ